MAPSGCLHTTLRGSLQERVLAATFGSSEVPALETIPPTLKQAADCYRALLSLSGLNGRGAPETNHSSPPLSTAAKQITLVSLPTGRDHTMFPSVQEKGHLCLHLGSGNGFAPHFTLTMHFSFLNKLTKFGRGKCAGDTEHTVQMSAQQRHNRNQKAKFLFIKTVQLFLILTSLLLLEFPSRLAKIQAGPLIAKFRLKKYLLMFLLKMFGNPN